MCDLLCAKERTLIGRGLFLSDGLMGMRGIREYEKRSERERKKNLDGNVQKF